MIEYFTKEFRFYKGDKGRGKGYLYLNVSTKNIFVEFLSCFGSFKKAL